MTETTSSEEQIVGIDTDPAVADELMAYINREWVDIERRLYTGKWFDYRFMHPVQATYLYAHEFKKAYRREFSRNIDSERGKYIPVFLMDKEEGRRTSRPTSDVFQAKRAIISGIWRGRQTADAMGMPYDLYIARAFHWTLNYWQQRHLPRPHQLYSDLVTDRAEIDWKERQAGRLYYSTHANYRNENYADLAAQNDHHDWLFEQIASRGSTRDLIARFVAEESLIPVEKARMKFGADKVDEVLENSNFKPASQRYN